MKITESERQAIIQVLGHAERWGYGNLISHLRTAWARKVMGELNCKTEQEAQNCTHGGSFYPFQMQQDIIERGYWDETGKRYLGNGKKKLNRPTKTIRNVALRRK